MVGDVDAVGPIGPGRVPPPSVQFPKGVPSGEELRKLGVDAVASVAEVQSGMALALPSGAAAVAPLDPDTLQRLSKEWGLSIQKLQADLALAENIRPQEAPPLEEWARENARELLKVAKAKAKAGEDWGQFSGGLVAYPSSVVGLADHFAAKPLEYYIGPLSGTTQVTGKITGEFFHAEFAYKVPETLGKAANIIFKRIVLNQVAMEIVDIEEQLRVSPDKSTQEEVERLKGWMRRQDQLLTKEAMALGVEAIACTPLAFKALTHILGVSTPAMQYAGTWVLSVAGVAVNSYEVYKAAESVQTHQEWMARFREKPVAAEPIKKGIVPEGVRSAISKLLQNRKNGLEKRMLENAVEFDIWAVRLRPEEHTFDELSQSFREKGISLESLNIASKEELQQALSDPAKRREVLQAYTEHKQTIAVMTRNGMKALAEKKHNIERKFLNFKLSSASISLAVSFLGAAAILTLKTLAVVGVIAIPTAAMGWTGVGLFAVGVILILVGVFLIYWYKPQIFKAFFQGVQLRLALYEIPHAFQSFRHNLHQIEALKESVALSRFRAQTQELKGLLKESEAIEAKDLPVAMRPLLERLKVKAEERLDRERLRELEKELDQMEVEETKRRTERLNAIEEKVRKLKESAEGWEKKMAPLKQQLLRAGWEDFLRESQLAKDRFGNAMRIDDVFVEGIFADDNLLDPMTLLILKYQLGIDIQSLRRMKNTEEVKKEVKEALKSFFAMNDTALIKFIEGQKAHFDFQEMKGAME